MPKATAHLDQSLAPQHIDQRIAETGGWRGETLARIRALIKAADPQIVEEWKWNVPVWSRHGIICTGEIYKSVVKTTSRMALPCPILRACSMPVLRARRAEPSTSRRAW